MKRSLVALLLSCFIPFFSNAQPEPPGFDYALGQKIPMRDGTHLSSFIWKPSGTNEPLPAICVLTPYGAERIHRDGKYFAENGYVVVSVDVRGRGNSEGEFYPFENDGPDGYDVVEWVARQPWCNGQVGMMGGSYRGSFSGRPSKKCRRT
jgi:putative CocE/NonD family hydrolase